MLLRIPTPLLLFREGLFEEDNKTDGEGETDNVEEELFDKLVVIIGSGGLFFGVPLFVKYGEPE